MALLDKTPAWAPRLARAVLPHRLAQVVRRLVRGRFYRSISMVSREPKSVAWFRRAVLHYEGLEIERHRCS
jgi:hypothetical protein